MSILKKLASLLFEESDADVIAEDEIEDISFPQEESVAYKKVEKKQSVQREFKQEEPKESVFLQTEEKDPVKKEEVKKFVSIEISDEPQKREQIKENADVRVRPVRNNTPREEKKDFEVTPVISPIFGSKDEKATSAKRSSMSITLPKPKKQNPLGTVISPYYGLGELEEFEAEAQESIQQKEITKLEEAMKENVAVIEDDEDMNSLSLDDLIMENDQQDDEDDMMQISLFGEATPLKDSDSEKNETVKEV